MVTLTTVYSRNVKQQLKSIGYFTQEECRGGMLAQIPTPRNGVCAEEPERLWGWECSVEEPAILVPELGGDSSPSPLQKGELVSKVEHTHNSTARLRLTPLRNQAKNIHHRTTCGSCNVFYYLRSIRWWRDRCCGHPQHWQTVHQCYEFIYLPQVLLSAALPVKGVRQGSTFPKGIAVSYTSKTSVTEEISYFDVVQEGGRERSRNFIARPAWLRRGTMCYIFKTPWGEKTLENSKKMFSVYV